VNIQISNNNNCRNYNKTNVCKYQENVIKEIEKIISDVDKLELPLLVNINCTEYSGKGLSVIR